MIRLDRITTRGGDSGDTSLGDGTRVRKTAARIEAIGAVDEANATIGLLRLHADPASDAMLARVQNDLFDFGADLSVPGAAGERLRLQDTACLRLEAEGEALRTRIPPLTSFVLPGGTPAAAYAHLARTVTRRAERALVALADSEPLNPVLVRYINRLSDFLFVLGRVLNEDGARDVLWVPGGAPRAEPG
jgi:cob(I)alamin adenosyltransferase